MCDSSKQQKHVLYLLVTAASLQVPMNNACIRGPSCCSNVEAALPQLEQADQA